MFGWLKRQWTKESDVVSSGDTGAATLAHLLEQLERANFGRKERENAAFIVDAFAKTCAEQNDFISDARLLQHSKGEILRAFDISIGSYEQYCTESSDKGAHETLERLRVLRFMVSDWQVIDREDEAAVAEANRGIMDDRRRMLLYWKYMERGMKERGMPVSDPLEKGEYRVSFDELCRRMLGGDWLATARTAMRQRALLVEEHRRGGMSLRARPPPRKGGRRIGVPGKRALKLLDSCGWGVGVLWVVEDPGHKFERGEQAGDWPVADDGLR